MERWREPWENEEEKEIFVSNVMQQVKANDDECYDMYCCFRLREKRGFCAATSLPVES